MPCWGHWPPGNGIARRLCLISSKAGAALGDYLHLCARRAVEVGALQGGTDLELLHAIARGRHNTRGSRSHTVTLVGNASRWVTGKAGRVHAHAAVHVVGVVSAIELEAALIHHGSSHTGP